jgi:hypothetical protein
MGKISLTGTTTTGSTTGSTTEITTGMTTENHQFFNLPFFQLF